jgi:hypothetical protein
MKRSGSKRMSSSFASPDIANMLPLLHKQAGTTFAGICRVARAGCSCLLRSGPTGQGAEPGSGRPTACIKEAVPVPFHYAERGLPSTYPARSEAQRRGQPAREHRRSVARAARRSAVTRRRSGRRPPAGGQAQACQCCRWAADRSESRTIF